MDESMTWSTHWPTPNDADDRRRRSLLRARPVAVEVTLDAQGPGRAHAHHRGRGMKAAPARHRTADGDHPGRGRRDCRHGDRLAEPVGGAPRHRRLHRGAEPGASPRAPRRWRPTRCGTTAQKNPGSSHPTGWAKPYGPVEMDAGVVLEASLEDQAGKFNLNSVVMPRRRARPAAPAPASDGPT